MAFLTTVIHKLDRNLLRALDARVSSFGISSTQSLVLDALGDGHATPSSLAEATGLDRASISTILQNLAGAGVVNRKHDLDDLRSVRILFTKKGDQLFKKVKAAVEEFEKTTMIKNKLKEII